MRALAGALLAHGRLSPLAPVLPAAFASTALRRAGLSARRSGLRLMPAYTPAMRRWVCIVALLAGFSADGYSWSARPRNPVPIERRLDIRPPGLVPTPAWWGRS